jgi:predicted permease
MTLSDLLLRLKALAFHRRAERDLDEELRAHIEMETSRGVRSGLPPEEAVRASLVAFGGAAQIAEQCRDERGITWIEDFTKDFFYAFRQSLKQKGFFAVAGLTLALGIGATTAIFSAVNGVLLRPLPYPSPERLVNVWSSIPSKGISQMGFALPDLEAVAARNHSFESIAGYFFNDINIAGEPPQRVQGVSAAANLFPLLGASAALGRTFSSSEQSFGQHYVVVLSDTLWRSRFGARQDVVGETVRLSGTPYTIIGVMRPEFQFPSAATQLWLPLSFAPKDGMATRDNHFISAVARLKPGISVERASADTYAIAIRLQREFPENTSIEGLASDYFASVVGNARPALLILLAAVGLVLLIACVNVANLLLARASSRQREFSLRTALGASRSRLIRQLLTEAALLGSLGAGLGIAVSAGLIRLMRAFGPGEIPRLQNVDIDIRVLAFTAALTLVCVLLFGLAPVFGLSRIEIGEALKEGGRSLSTGARTGRYRDALVIAEVTLALVLVIGAGLLLRSLSSLHQVDPGFRSDHVLTMALSLPYGTYENSAKTERFYKELNRKLEQIPGVKAAAASTALPIANVGGWGKNFTVAEHPASRASDVPLIQYRQVTPHYLRALQIPLLQGRFFSEEDDSRRPLVAVINESARRRFFPNEDPIGKQVFPGVPESLIKEILPTPGFRMPRLTIIGVIGDVHHAGLREPPYPELFVSHLQGSAKDNQESSSHMYLVIRTSADPSGIVPAVRAAVQSLDPDVPVAEIATMDERLHGSLSTTTFQVFVFGAFAALALLLAAAGIYGVMSYAVRLRIHEMGIRMALGAGTPDVLKMVLRHGLQIGFAGVVLGTILAAALTRLMSTLLFGVRAVDAPTFLGAAAVLLAVTAGASFIPSLRAARADPLDALRANRPPCA